MLFTPSIESDALDEFFDRLDASTDLRSGSAFADGMEDASDVYMESMRERFDLFSLRGGDWPEHAPMTIKERGPDAPILYQTGDLRRSLERSDAAHVLEVDERVITEGTDDPKARAHQDGDWSRRLPARPILVEPDAQTLELMKQSGVHGLQTSAKEAARGG